MALYMIGDLQGCDSALQRLLDTIDFSPSRDTLYVLGDLVNRGPESEAVLRRLVRYGNAARCILGNHDLHLLAVAHGVRKPGRQDTLHDLLASRARHTLLEWLRHQPLALLERFNGVPVLMVHAGVLPDWTAEQTVQLAREVETVLRSRHLPEFLAQMYGNAPHQWNNALQGTERLRVIVNALTRLRFCTAQGSMDFQHSGGIETAPAGLLPWFAVSERKTASTTIAFGHWSTLGWLDRTDLFALDSGCVWGGCLSALQVVPGAHWGSMQTRLIQVRCAQAQAPDI
jgi:bis(5'-nucleosyl)-tetraphosphatase (symmetrical)